MLLAAFLSVLAVAALAGCATGNSSSQDASNSVAVLSGASSDAEETETVDASEEAPLESLVVETDDYTLVLPEEWAKSAEVSYEDYTAVIHLKGNRELMLLRVKTVDSSAPMNGGDIGNGCFRRIELSNGKRLEFWGTNWLFMLSADAAHFDYVGDADKKALISLTSGMEIDPSDLPQSEKEYSETSFFEEYQTHMNDLVAAGLTTKVEVQ